MTRQEKRGMADLRAMKRHQRTNAILAVKAKKKVRPPVPDFRFPRLLRANLEYQKNC